MHYNILLHWDLREMANETDTKVRLVRCPKCQRILQELPEIPFYKCGGCSTVLQAKRRENGNTGPESRDHKTTTTANIEPGQDSVRKDIIGLHQGTRESTLSASGDTLHDECNERSRDEVEDYGANTSYDNLSNVRETTKHRENESDDVSSSFRGARDDTETASRVHREENESDDVSSSFRGARDDTETASRVHREAIRTPINESTSSETAPPIHRVRSDKDIALSSCNNNRSRVSKSAYDVSSSSCDWDDRYGHVFGNTSFNSPDEFQSEYESMDFASMSPQIIRRQHCSPSVYDKNIMHHSSDFNLSSPEPDRAELLRMVYELEDQLRKTNLGNGNVSNMIHRFSRCPENVFPTQFRTSRVPFRHRAHCSCSHCSPRSDIHCNFSNAHCSASSSPRHYTSSEYSPRSLETKRLRLRENYAKRRLVLPVLGRAPIIVCYRCSELLHLPADFAVFKRRCHRVRCGACRDILKFLVKNKTHVVPYLDENPAPPPPSEADDISNTMNNAESVSCSEDLRPSSCSSDDRKMKSVVTESDKTLESAEHLFMESKSEEAKQRIGYSLHRLMGYNSLSQVLNG